MTCEIEKRIKTSIEVADSLWRDIMRALGIRKKWIVRDFVSLSVRVSHSFNITK